MNQSPLKSLFVNREKIFWLTQNWRRFVAAFTTDAQTIRQVFDLLVAAYSQEQRAYHNLDHIHDMLRLSEDAVDSFDNAAAIGFAIWFHDAVYDSRRRDNEEESVALAARQLPLLNVDAGTIRQTSALILATKKHEAGDDTATKFLLDLDLAILGSEPEVYQQYSRSIRAEYAWVAEDDYRFGRLAVLEKFLEREHIYQTIDFRTRFDLRARHNIAEEITALSSTV